MSCKISNLYIVSLIFGMQWNSKLIYTKHKIRQNVYLYTSCPGLSSNHAWFLVLVKLKYHQGLCFLLRNTRAGTEQQIIHVGAVSFVILCSFSIDSWALQCLARCISHIEKQPVQGTNGKIKSGSDGIGESFPWEQKGTTSVGIVFAVVLVHNKHIKNKLVATNASLVIVNILCIQLHSYIYIETK